ncbi:hypothetical protein BLNAU_107 [Blattamonas nauphoetae]|uniref:Uncharacterized protein n=1 Tax=Blattamonas nauphoetae TaxID=2049346 RepID=A0ABQ9YM23_9EUKA|nr:hypothetical protein BLNAU_107 [Blattamonas nauphoetae]
MPPNSIFQSTSSIFNQFGGRYQQFAENVISTCVFVSMDSDAISSFALTATQTINSLCHTMETHTSLIDEQSTYSTITDAENSVLSMEEDLQRILSFMKDKHEFAPHLSHPHFSRRLSSSQSSTKVETFDITYPPKVHSVGLQSAPSRGRIDSISTNALYSHISAPKHLQSIPNSPSLPRQSPTDLPFQEGLSDSQREIGSVLTKSSHSVSHMESASQPSGFRLTPLAHERKMHSRKSRILMNKKRFVVTDVLPSEFSLSHLSNDPPTIAPKTTEAFLESWITSADQIKVPHFETKAELPLVLPSSESQPQSVTCHSSSTLRNQIFFTPKDEEEQQVDQFSEISFKKSHLMRETLEGQCLSEEKQKYAEALDRSAMQYRAAVLERAQKLLSRSQKEKNLEEMKRETYMGKLERLFEEREERIKSFNHSRLQHDNLQRARSRRIIDYLHDSEEKLADESPNTNQPSRSSSYLNVRNFVPRQSLSKPQSKTTPTKNHGKEEKGEVFTPFRAGSDAAMPSFNRKVDVTNVVDLLSQEERPDEIPKGWAILDTLT